MEILIIDGQGGKMGSLLIEKLKASEPVLKSQARLIAIGTNSIATASMLRAGATEGATGENPVVVNARHADVIVGPIGIVTADALLGEVTPAMAVAIGQSDAIKVLLPINKCNHYVVGVNDLPMGELVSQAVTYIESQI